MFQQLRFGLIVCLVVLCLSAVPVSLFAEKAEISPYAGYVWPGNFTNLGDFKGSQVFGVRGGGFITKSFELGGNYYWNPHFQPRRSNPDASLAGDLGFPQGAVRANTYEMEFTYHFGERSLFGSSVRPYIVGAGGGLTTNIKNEDTFVLNVRPVSAARVAFRPNDVLESGDTFFTFSYGGGVKGIRLWGPWGAFGDVRGRTVPNFLGHSNTWPEVNAGLIFSWGE